MYATQQLPISNLLLCYALELMLHMAVAHAPSADEHCIRGRTHPPKVCMGLAQQVLGAGRSGQLRWQALRDRELVPPLERLDLPCACPLNAGLRAQVSLPHCCLIARLANRQNRKPDRSRFLGSLVAVARSDLGRGASC